MLCRRIEDNLLARFRFIPFLYDLAFICSFVPLIFSNQLFASLTSILGLSCYKSNVFAAVLVRALLTLPTLIYRFTILTLYCFDSYQYVSLQVYSN